MPKLYEYFGLIIVVNGEVSEMRYFEELVSARATEIVSKWIVFSCCTNP